MRLKSFTTVFATVAITLTTAVAQAELINSFVNANFESGIVTTPGPFKGFDAPAAPEIIGWSNYGTVNDGGVEASGAWWIQGYAYGNCAFVNVGAGAFNLSSYVIQAGDLFDVSFIGDGWGASSATVSLFYNDPANVIDSYTSAMDAWYFAPHSTATPIAATMGSIGGTLGIRIVNDGANIIGFDEFTVNVTHVPEPTSIAMILFGGAGMLALRRRHS